MKKTVYLIILTLAGFYSCKDMDSIYREYVVPDGIVYPQRADSLKIYPGLERVKLTWLKAKDPKVVSAMVFWNNYTDSLGVNIPAGRDTVSVLIENLDEGVYTFHVKTFDADGNASIPTEITGTVYGANYALTLSPRPVTINAYYDRAELNWGAMANTVTKLAIRYESSSGSMIERNIPLDETLTPVADYKPGGAISVMTYHTPSPESLDPVILTSETTFPDVYELNKQGWSTVVSDSLLRADTPGGIGVIDGDINVMWHSDMSLYYPHWVVIDMKSVKAISRFEICQLPSYVYTQTFAVQFSNDNVNWSEAVNLVFPNNSTTRQSLLFDEPVEARYARIESVEGFSNSGGNRYAMITEVYVYGHD